MKRILSLLFALVFTLNFATAQQSVDPVLAGKLQQVLDSTAKALKMMGVSANIILGDNSVWNGYTGFGDPFVEAPINPEHLFWTASMGKLFLGATVMQLVEENKMSLDDPIGKYFNDIQYVDTNITIRELLKHRSGVKEFLSQTATAQWYNNPDKMWTPREALETYLGPKDFAHGTSFAYSNSNFVILGMVIEKVTGNTLAQEFRSRIFNPLGMEHSYFQPQETFIENITPCWSDFNQDGIFDDQSNFIHSTSFASMVFGAGAILSKSEEVSKFTRAVFRAELFNQSLLDEMKQCTSVSFGPNSTGYGIATMRYKFFNKDYFGHGGDISGFTTLTIHQPETNVTLTLMVNNDRRNRAALASALIKELNAASTGIGENSATPSVSLLENPVQEKLHFTITESALASTAAIYSLDGRKLASHTVSQADNQLDVSQLTQGIYLLVINDQNGVVSQRFVKN